MHVIASKPRTYVALSGTTRLKLQLATKLHIGLCTPSKRFLLHKDIVTGCNRRNEGVEVSVFLAV